MIDIADIASSGDLARMAQVKPNTLSNWRRRSTDFPEPFVTVASGPLFRRSDFTRWMATHTVTVITISKRSKAHPRSA